ncbi:Probable membrane protein, MmpS [Mycobacteroides abscessus subsp. abscessus]|nr:Probable membrane protein, MmpS [Mycobacteroides abscessus subsp. abscessus]
MPAAMASIVKDERTVTIVNGYTTCLDKSA